MKTNKIHKGFKVLKNKVLPKLENFANDVLVHDKEQLKGYEGSFISAYRPTGTNLVLLDKFLLPKNWGKHHVEELIEINHQWAVAFVEMNQFYLHIDENGNDRAISLDEVKVLLEQRRERALKAFKNVQDLHIRMIAYDLFDTIKRSPKRWKSMVRAEFENGTNPSMRRLRNRFDTKVLNEISADATVDSIDQLLTTKCFNSIMEAA